MKFSITLFFLLAIGGLQAQQVADFEDLAVEADSFLNGSDLAGGFQSGDFFFPNDYDSSFNSWMGWAISQDSDTTTPGFMNQYSAITGTGADSSATYAVSFFFGANVLRLADSIESQTIPGLYLTNSTYAYLSMREGDSFSKKFGGLTGDDPDFFLLTIKGHLDGETTSDSVDFYLADFRFSDNTQDFLIKDWTYVDLSSLGPVDSLSFSLSSSDVGEFGMNTPAYFCVDKVGSEQLSTGLFSRIRQPLAINIYPNPSTDYIRIDGSETASYIIYDVQGRQLQSAARILPGEAIPVSQLPEGNYFLQVQAGNKLGGGGFVKR